MTGTYRTDSSTGGQKMIRETTTENGAVRGIPAADPRITAFKGIPFAAPPAKENRWRAPVPAENWEGVLDVRPAEHVSSRCKSGVRPVVGRT